MVAHIILADEDCGQNAHHALLDSGKSLLQVVVSVQYQVIKENLYDAFYKLTDSRSQITSYVFDVVRATVPNINLDNVFTTKDEIALGRGNILSLH